MAAMSTDADPYETDSCTVLWTAHYGYLTCGDAERTGPPVELPGRYWCRVHGPISAESHPCGVGKSCKKDKACGGMGLEKQKEPVPEYADRRSSQPGLLIKNGSPV